MIVEALNISGVFLLKPKLTEDDRGSFFRGFCKNEFSEHNVGIDEIVQVNRSFNKLKGTFRGLHYQKPPYSEEKIVTCLSGSMADIIVDLRAGSNSYLQHIIVEISSANNYSVLIPKGFAHGFITLEDNTEILYMHTNYYTPDSESALSVFDPALNIILPARVSNISDRDNSRHFIDKNFKGISL